MLDCAPFPYAVEQNCRDQSSELRRRNALPTTLIDDNAMAAAAMIGEVLREHVAHAISSGDSKQQREKVAELFDVLARSGR